MPNCSGKETLLASPPCMRIIHKGRRQVNLVNKTSREVVTSSELRLNKPTLAHLVVKLIGNVC